ncbi:PqqD family protein [Spirosoma sp. KCTC 42546]|uniref:PqqD family protein n=1 Tax=Spirosoma sp. KCTC 42546 TaxID=2520506 RepID=UPI0011596C33|nr:PqqD family protein [Spirosoma sp. KCTC 42546]QDK82417.1 PqqD family protein [Spirosoma sp. KCTC 42546]
MIYTINSERILFTQLVEEGVVYDTMKNEYVTLNETFFKILKGIDQGKSSREIVAALCQEYNITQDECLRETNEALKVLEEKAYIKVNG